MLNSFPVVDYSIGCHPFSALRLVIFKMQTSDFQYQLPEELIANFPAEERSASRLLGLDASTGKLLHRSFKQLLDFVDAKDLLVFNNTRVIPARLFAQKETGGKVEILLERVLDDNKVMAQLRASKSPKPGSRLLFSGDAENLACAEVIGRDNEFYLLQFAADVDLPALLRTQGHMPLPPYIRRSDQAIDAQRYQTIYAKIDGAVAAPTAGLHFDEALLQALRDKGV